MYKENVHVHYYFGIEYIYIEYFHDFQEIKPQETNAPSLAFSHQIVQNRVNISGFCKPYDLGYHSYSIQIAKTAVNNMHMHENDCVPIKPYLCT